MTSIVAFIISNWRYLAIGGIILVVLAIIGGLKLEIRHLNSTIASDQAKISELQADNLTLETSNKALQGAVTKQNAAVAALRAQGEAKSKQAAKAVADAKNASKNYLSLISHIEKYKITGNECKDIGSMVDNYFSGVWK